jgi:hypothetical protein
LLACTCVHDTGAVAGDNVGGPVKNISRLSCLICGDSGGGIDDGSSSFSSSICSGLICSFCCNYKTMVQ